MSRKVKVPVHGKALGTATVEDGATEGAIVGVNLRKRDGTIVTEADLGGTTVVQQTSPGGGVFQSLWRLIREVPANLLNLAELATAGLVTRKSDDTFVTRTLTGTAGRITVANGDGDAGNPTVDLATLADSGTGAGLVKITRDSYGRVSGTQAASIGDLSDVDTTSVAPTNGQALVWDTDHWEPGTVSGGSGGEISGAFTLSGILSETLSAQADDWEPTGFSGASTIKVSLSGDQTITGFEATGSTVGRVLIVLNEDGTDTLTLAHYSTGSLTDNRIRCPGSTDFTLGPSEGAILQLHDEGISTAWRIVAKIGGSSLHYRRDDLTAVAGNDTITLDQTPYQDAVDIYEDGVLLAEDAYSVASLVYTLDSAAAGGEVYTVRYWTATASPGATTLTSSSTPQTWDPTNTHANITLSNGNRDATRSSTNNNQWRTTYGTQSRNSGKRYAEIERVAGSATNGSIMAGLVPSGFTLTNYPGQTSTSYGFQINNTGGTNYYNNGSSSNVWASYADTNGDRIGIAIDFDAGKGWIQLTDSSGFDGDPVAGTDPTFTFTPNATLFLACGLYDNPAQVRICSKATETNMTVPSGFSAWGG